MSIWIYRSQEEVDQALEAMGSYCGVRVAGEQWIILADTDETGARAIQEFAGRLVPPSGCG